MLTRTVLGLAALTVTASVAVVAVVGTTVVRPFDADAGIHPPLVEPETAGRISPPRQVTRSDLQPNPVTVEYPSYSLNHRLERGDTLGGLLGSIGITRDEAQAALSALQDLFDPRRMRAGQEVTVTVTQSIVGLESRAMQQLSFNVEFPYRVVVRRSADGAFEASRDERPLRRTATEAAGAIESSLFAAGAKADVPPAVVAEMLRMFSWDVDFQRDIQSGDRFAVLYDRFVDETGATIKSGIVSAATMMIGGKPRTVYRYEAKDGAADYYTADGRTARKALLRTPVDGARLSSRFGMRRHPILGYSKMHKGVDFAAPTGTPIYAAGDGTVQFVGRRGSYGKYIRIRHRSGYDTAYAHLSRYAKNLKRGRRVKQGQIIGYVGSTGRSTGPHLHYEILKGGRQINPLKVKTLPGRKLAGAELKAFRAFVAEADVRLAVLMDRARPTVVAAVKN